MKKIHFNSISLALLSTSLDLSSREYPICNEEFKYKPIDDFDMKDNVKLSKEELNESRKKFLKKKMKRKL